ncbi:MarR family winged helix-turn-helix transcriptional regulator [Saccharothrix australiensis]|uniref:MarR family transcriptional regulator n=1 Tax=Saccharothrix australiensis TaxID=2072 RepID=A0A495VUW7_9PSEU|nr:MarR family winged helix-turn-helix transcriptional regulator [Saccharothrix australiensis]RKT52155.1 MarR family transcriptional regulator [Saccharothrix australiensis]
MSTPQGDEVHEAQLARADRIGMGLVRLNKMHACVAAHMSKAGLDKASFVLLANLNHLGPSRSSALAEAVFSDPSTVSRQVATLVKAGWVERRADPADGRASVLAVTEAGERLLAERRRLRNQSIARMLADWSEEDLTAFVDHFERFVGDYERALPDFIAEGGLGPRSEGEK